jgi:hypothetical protein
MDLETGLDTRLVARRWRPVMAVTWGAHFFSELVLDRSLACAAAGFFPASAFPAGRFDEPAAPAGLGAAGLPGPALRPVLVFRTRFIMAPVT